MALNLAGYVIGTLLLSPLSDKVGRRNMLLVTMMLTGLASLWNALAPDYTQFVLARVLTGVAIGADLSIVNTYVGEVAPRRDRAKWTSVIFVNSALGALLGIWLGLFLTTPSAPWPHGLPFARGGYEKPGRLHRHGRRVLRLQRLGPHDLRAVRGELPDPGSRASGSSTGSGIWAGESGYC